MRTLADLYAALHEAQAIADGLRADDWAWSIVGLRSPEQLAVVRCLGRIPAALDALGEAIARQPQTGSITFKEK